MIKYLGSKRGLVPVRGGPHAELAMRLARDLGKRFGAQEAVLHEVPKRAGERALHESVLTAKRICDAVEHAWGSSRTWKPVRQS